MDIDILSKKILESPSNYLLYIERGLLYYKKANITAAYNDFTKVIELDPGNKQAAEYLSLLGNVMQYEYKETLNV